MQKSEGKLGKHDTTLENTAEMEEGEQKENGRWRKRPGKLQNGHILAKVTFLIMPAA